VHLDSIKSKLKPPGSKRLKLKFNVLLLNFAFKLKLRRHTTVDINLITSLTFLFKSLVQPHRGVDFKVAPPKP